MAASKTTLSFGMANCMDPLDAKTFRREAKLFLEVAIPTTLLSFGFALSPLLTASYVGLKFGPVYLSAFTLGNLMMNLSAFSILTGLFSAADTLSPQAFGIGNYREVGLIAIRGLLIGFACLIPINFVMFFCIEDWLLAAGQDPEAASLASQWYHIFMWALPFYALFNVLWKFLSSQQVMLPLIYVSIFASVVILPVALTVSTKYFGFLGSAIASVIFQAAQSILLLLYLWIFKPHKPETWGGLSSWREALKYERVLEYLHLGVGGILSQSEWVYNETVGLMIGSLGIIPLSTQTIPNQVIMMTCMVPFSFGSAISIRMGHVFASSADRARQIAAGATMISTILFGLSSILLYLMSDWIFAIFSNDEEVLALAHVIWWKVCIHNLNISIFGMLWGVATGLGIQWTLGAINLLFLWGFGVPVIYYSVIVRGGGLDAAWTWMNAPYFLMNASLTAIFMTTDWGKMQSKIREREDVESGSAREATEALLKVM